MIASNFQAFFGGAEAGFAEAVAFCPLRLALSEGFKIAAIPSQLDPASFVFNVLLLRNVLEQVHSRQFASTFHFATIQRYRVHLAEAFTGAGLCPGFYIRHRIHTRLPLG